MFGNMSFADRSAPVINVLVALTGVGMMVVNIDSKTRTIYAGAWVGAAIILISMILWVMSRKLRK